MASRTRKTTSTTVDQEIAQMATESKTSTSSTSSALAARLSVNGQRFATKARANTSEALRAVQSGDPKKIQEVARSWQMDLSVAEATEVLETWKALDARVRDEMARVFEQGRMS